MPYGYDVSSGYMGLVGNDEFVLFPTENEYYEFLYEREDEINEQS